MRAVQDYSSYNTTPSQPASPYGGAAGYLALLNASKLANQKAYSHNPVLPNGSPNNAPPVANQNPNLPSWAAPPGTVPFSVNPDANVPAMPSPQEQDRINSQPLEQQAPSGPSAYEQYQAMLSQYDPARMAKEQFDPQYTMLDRLNSDAKKRYGTNTKSMGDMYGALQASIRGDAAGIRSNYDTTGKALDQNYADTQKEVKGYQDNSRNQTAELMKNLGIQAAAPVGLNNMNESGDKWNKLMAANNLSNTNANAQNKASSLNYNNTMGQRAGFEGAAQQTGLMNNFNDFVNQNEVRRLGMQSEQSGVQSGYQTKLMDMYGQMASNEAKAQNDATTEEASAYKAAQAQANADRTFYAAQDKNAQSQMTPYDKLTSAATGMFANPDTDQNAANLIKAQYVGNDSKEFLNNQQSQSLNGNEFIRQLMIENPAILKQPGFSQASFENLARQYFDNMYKK